MAAMIVHVAENGRSYELACQGNTVVEMVHNTLAALTKIPVHDQMLICGDIRLEGSRLLSSYSLPADNRQVFLFNRARLLPDVLPPEVEPLELISVNIPQSPSLMDASHPLDESINPLLRALPSYERQFKYHLQKGQAIFEASQKRFSISRRLVQEQRVQEMALETACSNMELYYRHISSAHEDFMQQFSRQHAAHQDLLNSFEGDMERLRAYELHPAFHTRQPPRNTLLDCVKEDALRKWARDSAISHAHFAAKVGELRSGFAGLQRSVGQLLQTAPDIDVEHLEAKLEESHKYIEEQGSILQSLSKDLGTVRKLVDDCVSTRMSGSLRPLDACAALDPMSESHTESHLPRVESCDRKLMELVHHLRECKVTMHRCVHTQLQRVAALQSDIRAIRNQLAAFREALARQEEIFAELVLLRRVAKAYCACLLEVVRRQAFREIYSGQARQLAEIMARICEKEVAARNSFAREQSLYLPRDVLEGMGLLGSPSLCEVHVPPFDLDLLDVSLSYVQQVCALGSTFGSPSISEIKSITSRGARVSILQEGADAAAEEKEGGRESQGRQDLERARLRADLAGALAMVCALQQPMIGGANPAGGTAASSQASGNEVVRRTAEALQRKDEHVAQLEQALLQQRGDLAAYERRIRELEDRLAGPSAMQQSFLEKAPAPHGIQKSSNDRRQAGPARDPGHSKDLQGSMESSRMDGGESSMEEGSTVTLVGPRQGSITHALAQGFTPDGNVGTARKAEVPQSPVLGPPSCQVSDKLQAPVSSDTDARMGGAESVLGEEQRILWEGSQEEMSETLEGPAVETLKQQQVVEGESEQKGSKHKQSEPTVEVAMKTEVRVVQEKEDGQIEREAQMQQVALRQAARLHEAEQQRGDALRKVEDLQSQLEKKESMLSECQVNCAHLENRLHEVISKARTDLAGAERCKRDYDTLRSASVRMRGLLERLTRTLTAPTAPSPSVLANSLQSLAKSLASNEVTDGCEGDGNQWVVATVRSLASTIAIIARGREQLQQEVAQQQAKLLVLAPRVEKAEKRAVWLARSKICYTQFAVHELAAFAPTKEGHWMAINRGCPYYFLSSQSVDLFHQQQSFAPCQQHQQTGCIVGQIVHIEKKVAQMEPSSGEEGSLNRIPNSENSRIGLGSTLEPQQRGSGNPYGLTPNTTFYVLTVAMVPESSNFLSPNSNPGSPPLRLPSLPDTAGASGSPPRAATSSSSEGDP